MEGNFYTDYLHYSSGNMCPQRFHLWSATSILAATAGRRFYFDHEYFRVFPMNFICLVGRQGLRKSTGKDLAKDLFTETFPDYPLSPSTQSREDFVKRLASDDFQRVFRDENGASVEWRPVMCFVNELKNFLSVNPGLFIDTLTDLYDRPFYDASTIKHGLQTIINPCINILACETPRWIIDKLKMNIISGGFSRRVLFIYVTDRPHRVTFPKIPVGGIEARNRCKDHLLRVSNLAGKFSFAPDAKLFFDHWYKNLSTPDDELMEGYYENKDILVIKLAMCLCLADYNPKFVFTIEKLQIAIAMLEANETNLPKLTVAAGRSEVALPQQRVMEYLTNRGGLMPEKVLMKETSKEFRNPMEQISCLRAMYDNDSLVKQSLIIPPDKIQRVWILLPETWATWNRNGEVERKEKT